MANPIIQYFKDTRSELNHVAWPTQRQTAVFTALVIAISLGVAAYVGVLDYAFRDALFEVVSLSGNTNASNAIQVTQQPVTASTSAGTTQAPVVSGPSFTIPGATSNTTQ
jgi:preprotein translocase SecE subunit